MPKFRTRIVEIEAERFDGYNFPKLHNWTDGNFRQANIKSSNDEGLELTGEVFDKLHHTWIGVAPGQWIVRGVKGEYYPCDNETFRWKYEEI